MQFRNTGSFPLRVEGGVQQFDCNACGISVIATPPPKEVPMPLGLLSDVSTDAGSEPFSEESPCAFNSESLLSSMRERAPPPPVPAGQIVRTQTQASPAPPPPPVLHKPGPCKVESFQRSQPEVLMSPGDGITYNKYNFDMNTTTTVVIRNISARFRKKDLLEFWQADGQIDMMHLPYNIHANRPLGMAIVNFTSPTHAMKFCSEWKGRRLQGTRGRELDIWAAERQGLEANLAYFRSRRLERLKNIEFLPMFFHGSLCVDTLRVLAGESIEQAAWFGAECADRELAATSL